MKKTIIILTLAVLLFCTGFFGYYIIKDKASKEIYRMFGTLLPPAYTASAPPSPSEDDETGTSPVPTGETQSEPGTEKEDGQNPGGQAGTKSGGKITPAVRAEIEDAIALVYSRMGTDEIAEILTMQAGGFTAAEKKKIKEIVYAKFSSSEITHFLYLYNQYGDEYLKG